MINSNSIFLFAGDMQPENDMANKKRRQEGPALKKAAGAIHSGLEAFCGCFFT